jgi:hypothetical protein
MVSIQKSGEICKVVLCFLAFLLIVKKSLKMNAAEHFWLLIRVRSKKIKEAIMLNDDKHEFHFMMNRGMKERIRGLEIFRVYKGLSRVIVEILGVLAPVMREEHKWGEQRWTRYRCICNDPDEIRDSVHVYMPKKLYRKLKLLHQDLNFYSIAQLVRGFIEWFLVFAEGCKGDVLQELKKIFVKWKTQRKQTRLTVREYLRQLETIIRHLPGRDRLVTIYNHDFSPFWILRM